MADIHSVAARRESGSRLILGACQDVRGCPCVTLPHGSSPLRCWLSSGLLLPGTPLKSRKAATSTVSRVPHRNSIPGVKMPENDIIISNWRKSTASGTSECVEVASFRQSVLVRDSKRHSPHALRFTSSEWQKFLSRLRTGTFDPANEGACVPQPLPWPN